MQLHLSWSAVLVAMMALKVFLPPHHPVLRWRTRKTTGKFNGAAVACNCRRWWKKTAVTIAPRIKPRPNRTWRRSPNQSGNQSQNQIGKQNQSLNQSLNQPLKLHKKRQIPCPRLVQVHSSWKHPLVLRNALQLWRHSEWSVSGRFHIVQQILVLVI